MARFDPGMVGQGGTFVNTPGPLRNLSGLRFNAVLLFFVVTFGAQRRLPFRATKKKKKRSEALLIALIRAINARFGFEEEAPTRPVPTGAAANFSRGAHRGEELLICRESLESTRRRRSAWSLNFGRLSAVFISRRKTRRVRENTPRIVVPSLSRTRKMAKSRSIHDPPGHSANFMIYGRRMRTRCHQPS